MKSPMFRSCIPCEEHERPLCGRGEYAPIVTLDGKTEHQEVRSTQGALVLVLVVIGLAVLGAVCLSW